ncbi:transcription elongation factor B polypeptide 3 like protein [Danaus plexippus plexippus]|uniref:Transcription elongation factor B polypeptide 3 like protein n=1 Tax=Danaus plexippus plexippus TaxID=278856 RepID=A0A212F7B5_DANPL|nr:transcription elongation factor B polypeptide 3 like protein [Danaus plexippus plexippus]
MASVLDLVKHYQRSIEKYPNDEQKILKSIDKLYHLKVTVQHLQDTGVGRTVNALRKEPGEIGQAARALVLKWKVMVAAEESDHEDHNDDTQNYSSHDNGRDYDSNPSKSTSKHDTSEKSNRRSKTEEKYHKQTNGDYSGNKRKYQSSEEEDHDNTKKSKYSQDNGYNIKSESRKKIESSESENSEDESSQSDSGSEDTKSEDEEEEIPDTEAKVVKNQHKESYKPSHLRQSSSSHQSKHKHESRHDREDSKQSKEHNDSSDKRHSSDKPKDKSHSSHSHKSSKGHEKSLDKKDKENRHSDKEKQIKEDSSKHSTKHRSGSSSDKTKSSGTDKHKSSESSHKHKSSKSEDKHRSSSSSEKNKKLVPEYHKSHSERTSSSTDKQSSQISDKHKKSSHKDVSNDKHKSKEHDDKKDEQVKEKSKEKHSSSKDKESHKSEKKHSSKESGDSKRKSDSNHNSDSSKKSKHKSSSSKQSNKSREDKEKQPKRTEDSDDGIDCGSGASFAEALGMISPSKPKKKSIFSKDNMQSPRSPSDNLNPPNLLAPSAKLAPLPSLEISALPEISPNYRPRPPPKFLPHFSDEDAMSSAISSKNQRTKVYSGNKVIGKITTLYEMCVHVLQEHIDALEYTGGVPYEILKPVVDKATPQQLFVLEHYNPYLMDDTDHLWQKFCEKSFRNKKRQEMETWREMYIRCQEEQEIKLKSLTANIKMTQEAKKAPIKQTKMAYVDTVVKPPRNVAKKQAQHGTAFAATASPAARVASLSAAPNVLKGGRAAPAPVITNSSNFKPKKAPLMQKALQFMRGRKR